jgi:hypothetical protein
VTWANDEEHESGLGRELRRLGRRARRRPWLCSVLALGLAAALFGVQLRRHPHYTVTVRLLLSESGGGATAGGEGAAPRPRGEVRSLVNDVVFTSSRLEQLITRHRLRQELGEEQMQAALDQMRKRIDLEISDDYFLDYRYEGDAPRSARILISYTARNPDLALAVARDLGEQVVLTQAAGLLVRMEQALGHARREREVQRRAFAEAVTARAVAPSRPSNSPRARRAADQVLLTERRLSTADTLVEERRLALEATRQELAPRVQVIDTGDVGHGEQELSARLRMASMAGLALAVSLPLVVLMVGAFDRRLYDLEDVSRAGYHGIAHLRQPLSGSEAV